ncbi:MAG TPA: CRISPR-associated endonuclease Cas1 [Phnomibacter sp.]|nr:CRISPR-associated endonuclease Cas1 [Phnomibacter sp.]
MTALNIVVQKHGTRIGLCNGLLSITNGQQEHKIPLNKIKSLQLTRSCIITTDALLLALEQGIDVLFVGRKGDPLGRLWNSRFGSISTIRKNQLAFAESAAAVTWMKGLLMMKLQHQQALLITLYRTDRATDQLIEETITYLDGYEKKIKDSAADKVSALADTWRGWEGSCSRKYFACLNQHLPDMYRFEKRSQHPAKDMFNALLNYAYGMLYGIIEGALIKAGVDPFIGIMHRNEYNKAVLSFDIIEVFRYWADYVVCNLCMQQVIFPDMFEIEADDYWLAPAGKRILVQSMQDYLDEVIEWQKLERSRTTHIELFCQQLAAMLKQYDGAKVTNQLHY